MERKTVQINVGRGVQRKLNYFLPVLIGILVIAVLLLNARMFNQLTNEQAESLGREQLEMVSHELEGTLNEAELLTRKVAAGTELLLQKNASMEKLQTYFRNWKKNPGDESCINVYVAGDDWYFIPDFVEPEGFVPKERVWYQGARKKGVGNIYISVPYLDAATGGMCFTVSVLLEDKKTVVALDFNLLAVQESIHEIGQNGGGDALIISSAGQIIGYSDESVIGKSVSEALPQYTTVFRRILSSGDSRKYFNTKIDGTDSTVFYSLTGNQWYLLSTVSDWDLYKDNYMQVLRNSLFNLFLVVGIIVLYIWNYRSKIRVEKALRVKEEFLAGMSSQLQLPMKDILWHSDYEQFLGSDDKKAYMGRLKESAYRLDQMLSNLISYTDLVYTDEREKREQEKGNKKKAGLTEGKNRFIMVAVTLILCCTLVISVGISSNLMIRWGNTSMEREVDSYVSELNAWVVEQKSILDMFVSNISANPEILDNYDEAVTWLNDITTQHEGISVTYMTNPEAEHTVIMNNGWQPEEGWKVEERQWYIDTIASEQENGFSISAPYYDEQTGVYCVTFSERVYDKDGNFLGNFGVDFYLDKLTQILSANYTDEGYAFLVDRDGQIINHPNKKYELSDVNSVSVEKAGYQKVLYTENAVWFKDYDGHFKTAMEKTDTASNFSIIGVKNWMANYGNMLWYSIILVFLFSVCIFGIIYLLRRQMAWQRQANKMLEDSVEAATRAGNAKSRFLAQMSHEIRTPINAVLGMNEMIMRECGEREILSYAENIQNAGRTLLSLINSILDFSKIEDGKMEIVPVNYDTASVINDLVNMVQERADKKGLEFILESDAELPKTMYGDDVRIRQVITNLLTNAVKYTEKGTIWLRLKGTERTKEKVILHVEVEDTGMGIRSEDMEKLFQSFQRLDLEKNRTIEGTGLGVSIVQKLLAMMGSELEVDSIYGKGSKFWFEIEQGIIEEEPIGDYEKRLAESRNSSGEERYVYAPDARVLVVDDNLMNLQVARGLLKRSGMRVDTATGGAEGIQLVETNFYDIVFLDHMMPEMDGIETLQIMKQREILSSDTTVVMMTANAIVGAKEEYLEAGFDDYLSKPVEVDRMEKILVKYLPEEKRTFRFMENVASEETEGHRNKDAALEETESPEKEDAAVEGTEELAEKDAALEEADEPVIDQAVGLKFCMNNPDFYKQMIRTYLSECEEKKEVLSSALEQEDIKNYTVQIHGLKSNSKMIGAAAFAEKAFELEKAGKEGNITYLKENHRIVMEEYDKVLAEAKTLL